ncbi:MAG: hypothetical protein KA116_12280 [Proteobacteria bacterium]|nr:hypothetical protein [Pseudomonadota bacterium]
MKPANQDTKGLIQYRIENTDKAVLFAQSQEPFSLDNITLRMNPEALGWSQDGTVGISGAIGNWTLDWLKSKLIAPIKESCKFDIKDEYVQELKKEDPTLGDRANSMMKAAVDLASKFCSSDIKTLSLNSVGGNLESAEIIGWAMKIAGIEVKVPKRGICASSCIEIFQRAKTRLAADDAFFMFHLAAVGENKIKELVYSHKILPSDFQKKVLEGKDLYLSSQVALDIGLVTQVSI